MHRKLWLFKMRPCNSIRWFVRQTPLHIRPLHLVPVSDTRLTPLPLPGTRSIPKLSSSLRNGTFNPFTWRWSQTPMTSPPPLIAAAAGLRRHHPEFLLTPTLARKKLSLPPSTTKTTKVHHHRAGACQLPLSITAATATIDAATAMNCR